MTGNVEIKIDDLLRAGQDLAAAANTFSLAVLAEDDARTVAVFGAVLDQTLAAWKTLVAP